METASRPSILATETFAARAQRSDERRVTIWTVTLAIVLALAIVRRLMSSETTLPDRLFWPTTAVLAAGVLAQAALRVSLRRANREGRLLPPLVWRGSAFLDLSIPAALLAMLAVHSPQGAATALSAPGLMLFPLVVLLSILRLRPTLTLAIGMAAAVFHAALAARAILVADPPREQYPVYFSYGVVLALLAVAGTYVASAVKAHVVAAADEAAARARADECMAGMRRDLSLARDIQKGLLPSESPIFSGFEVAGMSRPADLTGGDYYDWQILADGRLIAVLADVSGHGIAPALVMAVCRAYARASASMISDPAPLMRRLNELLLADLPADRFITLAIAILDPGGQVQLLSAGHGPSLFYCAGSCQVHQYGGDGLPLGISPTERYEPAALLTMEDGDMLVLLTDGFHEWRRDSDDEPFGIDRVERVLVAQAANSPREILDSFDHAVRTFAAGAVQQDDTTAVVIKRTSCSHPLHRSIVQAAPTIAHGHIPA